VQQNTQNPERSILLHLLDLGKSNAEKPSVPGSTPEQLFYMNTTKHTEEQLLDVQGL